MKWFKKLLREKSASHCSYPQPTSPAIRVAITKRCLIVRSDVGPVTENGAVNNDESAVRNACNADDTMTPKGGAGLVDGKRRPIGPKRRWTTSPYRSASRLMARLEDSISQPDLLLDEADVSTKTFLPAIGCDESISRIVDPDDFFEDPDEVRTYCAEKRWMAEWCVVDHHTCLGSDEEDDDPDGRYATTTFCGEPDEPDDEDDDDYLSDFGEETFVAVQRTPSVISLSSYVDDKYGIFHGVCHGRWSPPKIPEAAYYYSFEYDVQAGLALDTSISAFEEIMVETFHLDTRESPSKTKPTPDDLRPSSPVTALSIARVFQLDDDGSICLNMEHIHEERGYGFLMRRNKQLYRHVEWGQMVDEQRHRRRRNEAVTMLKSIVCGLRRIVLCQQRGEFCWKGFR